MPHFWHILWPAAARIRFVCHSAVRVVYVVLSGELGAERCHVAEVTCGLCYIYIYIYIYTRIQICMYIYIYIYMCVYI